MDPIKFLKPLLLSLILTFPLYAFPQTILNTPNVNSVLFTGEGKNQPLIVGLGGSEGGNAWASDHWKSTRDQFIAKGYAFLALGYFGAKGTPDTLDRISIDAVHQAIAEAARQPGINPKKIAIVGGSRGADLALLLGSYYPDITCVVGLVASNAVFPGHTMHFSTPAWTYGGQQLPFVPLSEEAVPALIQRDLRKTFEIMLKDSIAAEKAAIHVENINGPILLLSATRDEIVPTTPMAEKITARLKATGFKHVYQHVAIEGPHAEPLKHFDLVFAFLEQNFLGLKAKGLKVGR